MSTLPRAIALALLIIPLALLSPALSQSPPVPTAVASTGFAPFTAVFQPKISNGSLYQWQFNYVAGSEFIPDYTSEAFSDVRFTYPREGNYIARLRVYDTESGLPSDYDVPITVYPPPVPPVVHVSGSDPHIAGAGVPTPFSASAVASPGLAIASYHWEFLGGASTSCAGGPAATATFTYPSVGTYTAKVTAIDTFGLAGFATFTVQVIRPPSVRLGTATEYVGRGAPFDLQAFATTDSGHRIVEYRWDFDGDGVVDAVQSTSGELAKHAFTYPEARLYLASVTVVDDAGLQGSDTLALPVQLLIMDEVRDPSGTKSRSVTFAATKYLLPGTKALGFDWDFGDGATKTTGPNETSVTHLYENTSPCRASVRVRINDGTTWTAPFIDIGPGGIRLGKDVGPGGFPGLEISGRLILPGGATVRVGRDLPLTAFVEAGSSSTVPVTITQVAWDFDGDGLRDYVEDFAAAKLVQGTSSVKYQYQYPGTYTVKVAAGTTFGQTLVGSFRVTVTQGIPPVECWIVQPVNGRVVGGNHLTVSARGSPGNQVAAITFQYRRSGDGPWKTIARVVPPPATALSTGWNIKGLASGAYDLQAVVAGTDGSTSSSWSAQPVTITVDRQRRSDEDESVDDEGVVQYRVHVVDPNRGDRTEISQDTRVEFPPHSTTSSGGEYARCRIERLASDPHPAETRFQRITFIPGLFRRLDLGSEQLTAPARVSLYVPTPSLEEALRAASVHRAAEKNLELTIYRFDDVDTQSWVPLFSNVRQPSEELVRASTMTMGDLGVGFKADTLSRESAASGGSWSGCGALGIDGLLLALLLAGLRPRRR